MEVEEPYGVAETGQAERAAAEKWGYSCEMQSWYHPLVVRLGTWAATSCVVYGRVEATWTI